MTTETPVTPAAPAPEYSAQPAPAAPAVATTGNGLSVAALVLSIASIALGQGLLAVIGLIFGFIARNQEPAHRNIANWGIAVGFVSLFAWVFFAIIGVAVFAPFALWGLLGG